jgi:cytosine/creatinine deaminase
MHVFRRARVPLACLPSTFITSPPGGDDRFEPWRECEILTDKDQITAVRLAGDGTPPPASGEVGGATDLGGCLVFPGLVDAHTHLDKCHTWTRAPNPRGEFWDALEILRRDSARWTPEDLYRRAGFGLRGQGRVAAGPAKVPLQTVGEVSVADRRFVPRC